MVIYIEFLYISVPGMILSINTKTIAYVTQLTSLNTCVLHHGYSVDITVYQYRKNVLYFFYNIAQRTLTEERRKISRVDIELYQHGS